MTIDKAIECYGMLSGIVTTLIKLENATRSLLSVLPILLVCHNLIIITAPCSSSLPLLARTRMDHQDREIVINRWFDLRRRAVAQLMCAIVYLYVNLEGFDAPHFDFTVPETQSLDPSPIASGSKKKKLKVAKNKESNNEMIEMKESMNMVAEALREGNEIMRERQKYDLPPISGQETWNLIEGCGCEAASLPEIYCAVMNDVNKLRMILQCPLEARKAVIMQLVFGLSD
ncbi:uncharacterized protein LOC123904991 [Trifolium pratense]|uniref:uncharacterized protein LOC123904991 n=1 Tax=Trifolium pratense TaxID=57577 RepID=UPI001E692732|nr:uncharacterized protein LOC123904991 [Trifolium pratense]